MRKLYEVEVYLFGETRTVLFRANESIEELEHDQGLVYNYVLNSLGNDMHIQSGIEEV